MEEAIPEMIRRLRLERGWTQAQLAGYACVSGETIVMLEDLAEAGSVNFLSLTKVAGALGHDVGLQPRHIPNLLELVEQNKAAFKPTTEKGRGAAVRQKRKANQEPPEWQ